MPKIAHRFPKSVKGSTGKMTSPVKLVGILVAIILVTVNVYCMYRMMIIDTRSSSSQLDLLRQQQQEFKHEGVPVPPRLPPENCEGALVGGGGRDSSKEESEKEESAKEDSLSKEESEKEESAKAKSTEADTSRYYVTPRASTHMKTNGQKPTVSEKHALSVTALKRQVHTPIFVMGMMKAGTTSIFGYFRCGLRKQDERFISHYDCKPNIHNRAKIKMSCGRRMYTNIHFRKDRETFDGMDEFAVYSEIDAQLEKAPYIILPQYSYLHQIHEKYPRATFILNMRDPKAWIKSIDKWQDLRQRFIDIDLKDFKAGKGKTDEELEEFYLLQAQKVRDFVKVFPSHELIEVDIGGEEAGQIMQDSFGITKDCWGIRNSNPNGKAEWNMLPDHMVQEKEAAKTA